MERTALKIQLNAWLISLVVVTLAVLAWGSSYHWRLGGLTAYDIFPVLGLSAFSLMWSHYAAGTLRLLTDQPPVILRSYYRLTSYLVLVLILLHPGIFLVQLYRDGFGLPPTSYLHYLPPNLHLYVIFGTIALLAFLLYELKEVYSSRSWWRWMERANDCAIVLVFIHGLMLGGQTRQGWYGAVWLFYGVLLVPMLGYGYLRRRSENNLIAESLSDTV